MNSCGPKPRLFRAGLLLAAASALFVPAVYPTASFAAMQVAGSRDAVRLEAQDASVEELLGGLASSFNIQWRSSIKLQNRLVGTYVGPLPRVLARVLEGYDFVVKSSHGTTEVIVLGAKSGSPAGAAAAAQHGRAPLAGSAPAQQAATTASAPVEPRKQVSAPEGVRPPEAQDITVSEWPTPAAPGQQGGVPEQLPPTMTLEPSKEPAQGPVPRTFADLSPTPVPINSTAPAGEPGAEKAAK